MRLYGQERPFSEQLATDENNEPSKGRKSFPGRGHSMALGPDMAQRNELGWKGGGVVGARTPGGTVLTCVGLSPVV